VLTTLAVQVAVFTALSLALQPLPVRAASAPGESARSQCMDSYPASARILDRTLTLSGASESRVDLPTTGRADMLVYWIESGVDVEI